MEFRKYAAPNISIFLSNLKQNVLVFAIIWNVNIWTCLYEFEFRGARASNCTEVKFERGHTQKIVLYAVYALQLDACNNRTSQATGDDGTHGREYADNLLEHLFVHFMFIACFEDEILLFEPKHIYYVSYSVR